MRALSFLLLLAAAAPALAQPVTVQVAVDTGGAATRLVLTHSRELPFSVRAEAGRVVVAYGESVVLQPAQARVDDALLERYLLEDGRNLVLVTGPGYRRYEQFELHNPFRLVLDLQGLREGGAAEPAPVVATRDPSKTIVVLDPGHGGIENGAVGPTGLQEKDVTLDLALRLRALLERDAGLAVVLTRDEDRLLGLDERTAIANHNRADLFVSIHLNSSPRGNATGAETYFLSADATDDAARTLAALENRASHVAADALAGAGKERKDLDLVLWDLAQNQYIAESASLAEAVQREMNELVGTRDRGVRQAPFRVLMGATMPAILVEVGFISNPEEETKFKTLGYRNQTVQALAAAIRQFLHNLERLSAPVPRAPGAP